MNVVFSTVNHTPAQLTWLRQSFHDHGLQVRAAVGHPGLTTKFRDAFPDADYYSFFAPLRSNEKLPVADLGGFSSIMARQWHTILPLADRHPPAGQGHFEGATRALMEFARASTILRRHEPDAVVFFKEPERLLEYFLYLLAQDLRLPCMMSRAGLTPFSAGAATSIDAPLLGENHEPHDQTAPVGKGPSLTGAQPHVSTSHVIDRILSAWEQRDSAYSPDYMIRQRLRLRAREHLRPLLSADAVKTFLRSGTRPASGELFRFRLLRKYQSLAASLDQIDNAIGQADTSVFVPLHYQPEQTTTPLGGQWANQALMVKAISDRLPVNSVILVKEHPTTFSDASNSTVSDRSYEYYEHLLAIKGVMLVPLTISSMWLEQNSDITASVRGTASFEAAVGGRTGLVFSSVAFATMPGIKQWREGSGILSAINDPVGPQANKSRVDSILTYAARFDALTLEAPPQVASIWNSPYLGARAHALDTALQWLTKDTSRMRPPP